MLLLPRLRLREQRPQPLRRRARRVVLRRRRTILDETTVLVTAQCTACKLTSLLDIAPLLMPNTLNAVYRTKHARKPAKTTS